MKYLILADINDSTALKLYAHLSLNHSKDELRFISGEELAFAQNWSHSLDLNVNTSFTLSDGQSIKSNHIGVVFNRLRYAPMPHFENSNKDDRAYAQLEMYALLLSWLHSLPCTVINQVTPQGLSAREFSQYKWLILAQRAGLPVRNYLYSTNARRYSNSQYQPYRLHSGQTYQYLKPELIKPQLIGKQAIKFLEPITCKLKRVLLIGDVMLGDLDSKYVDACKKLSRIVNCDLLEFEFAETAAEWKVTSINAFPSITNNDEIAAIGTHMQKSLIAGENT